VSAVIEMNNDHDETTRESLQCIESFKYQAEGRDGMGCDGINAMPCDDIHIHADIDIDVLC
jgi:hypothetical protein